MAGEGLKLFLVVGWFTCNIGVLLLNKYLLSTFKFRRPVTLTTLHMLACTLFSAAAGTWCIPRQQVQSQQQLAKIATLALLFISSVVMGNVSLRYIPVSFNQAIGSTTPFFTAIFAALIQGKVEHWVTYATLVPVIAGIVLATSVELSFHTGGFTAALLATSARALKTVVQAVLLSTPEEKMDSMNLLMYMAPITLLALVPTATVLEPGALEDLGRLSGESGWFVAALLLNCAVAYLTNLLNFLVTKHTSALTIQVLGNFKGVVAVMVSLLLFRNPVTITGMVGYGLSVMGVIAYSESKKWAKEGRLPAWGSEGGPGGGLVGGGGGGGGGGGHLPVPGSPGRGNRRMSDFASKV